MPATIEKPQATVSLLTHTSWKVIERPAVMTATVWLTVEDEPFVLQEHRDADSQDELTLENSAAAQAQFLASINHLEFVD